VNLSVRRALHIEAGFLGYAIYLADFIEHLKLARGLHGIGQVKVLRG
jgi:hypothetical protein